MGFAASQARLLLLTARKSDLEFRAQQITNSEMLLAMQTEEIAREYSNKLSNQTLKFNGTDGAVDIKASTLFDTTQGLSLQVYVGPTPASDKDFKNNSNWETWTSSSGYDDFDGMRSVKEAAMSGDYLLAKDELLAYYRDVLPTRSQPQATHPGKIFSLSFFGATFHNSN